MNPIKAIKVAGFDEAYKVGVGAFFFASDKRTVFAILPNTTIVHSINLGSSPDRPIWKWNGDEENPTLIPSLLLPEWHGFLTNGQFVTC